MPPLKVWVSSKDNGWEQGELVEDCGTNVRVKCGAEERTVSHSEIFRSDISHFSDLDDLCTMTYLHEAPLLDALRRRFQKNCVYTSAGDVLLSLNPYKSIPNLYDNPLYYLDLADDGEVDASATKPHVFKIANFALLQMLYGKKLSSEESAPVNQSIIVSGESGAGKTEASKHVMNFLIAADKEMVAGQAVAGFEDEHLGDSIRDVLTRSNIIFESFGNAKTVRNDNSSRFGKYIKLQYSENYRIVSAFTETFLLEKSRLVAVSANERNYHVFYQLIRGCGDEALLKSLHLRDAGDFRMLADCNKVAAEAPQDQQFGELRHALETVGCTEEELTTLWTLLAALLHTGNLTCREKPPQGPEQDGTEGGNPLDGPDEGAVQIISSLISLDELAEMLGISSQTFRSRLTMQRVKVSTRRSVTMRRLNQIDVSNNIAALIKWMYSCIFSWLVMKVNYAHCSVSSADVEANKFIGILDIFGFEILQTNSFEQLCINYTNERLQQQFNEFVFDREQSMYSAEGLDWTVICYKDNQHVIDLIGKKPLGLLPILEAQGMLNRGSADESALIASFNQTHAKAAAYERSRFTDLRFTIRHFAGDVTYTVAGFLDKNNDSLQEDLLELMMCSTNAFIRNAVVSVGMGEEGTPGEPGFVPRIDTGKLVSSLSTAMPMTRDPTKRIATTGRRASLVADSGGKKLASTVTVSFQFRSQLDILMNTLRSTSPHYIKCIKPNAQKQPDSFSGCLVLEQLRYSGALEVVRIRQEGYSVCLTFLQFYEIFEKLAFQRGWTPSEHSNDDEAKGYATVLLNENLQSLVDFQVGKTKVFLKSDSYEKMHFAVEAFLGQKVRKFQGLVRRNMAVKRFRAAVRSVLAIQKTIRMQLARKRYRKSMAEKLAQWEAERLRVESEEQRIANERRLAREMLEKRIFALHDAAKHGDVATVRAALAANPEDGRAVDSRMHNCTLLHSASLGGNLSMVEFLQPKREDLRMADDRGYTCCTYAVEGLALDVLRFFLLIENAHAQQDVGLESAVSSMGKTRERELRAGWLQKRGESNIWRKRYVKLTTEALMYFRNARDTVPRDTLSFAVQNDLRIERAVGKPNAIDIFINHQSAVKKRGRVSLMADSEQDMQIWMNLLKAAAGVRTGALRTDGAIPVHALSDGALLHFAQQCAKSEDNLLHVLVRRAAADPTRDRGDLQQLGAWLCCNGCDGSAFNGDGLTPLQLASQLGQEELASLFAYFGADPEQTAGGPSGHRNSLSLSPSVQFQLQLKRSFESYNLGEHSADRFKPAPPMLRGFHYLALQFLCSEIASPK